jgi:putative addiction module component (TIGR02574 family)
MELSPELVHQVFSLPPHERYQLAHQLLDSIDDSAAADLDQEFLAELRRRREEMVRGEEVVADWRTALSAIENALPAENQR